MGRLRRFFEEVWFLVNDFLMTTLRDILSKKVIDILIVYTLYLLIIMSISYAGYRLFIDMYGHFLLPPNENKFPFILSFSENIFLYFLPIFILFGLLNYYSLELKRIIIQSNKPSPNSESSLNLSKKLFFSSILSYTALKIIEKLFFEFNEFTNNLQLISIGAFFVIIIIFVIFQNNHRQKKYKEVE